MRRYGTRFVIPMIVLWVAGTWGCAGNINPERQIDDAILSANVRDALNADADLRRHEIVVNANGGMVTLHGRVSSNSERARAGTIAERVDGVTTVVNELRVD